MLVAFSFLLLLDYLSVGGNSNIANRAPRAGASARPHAAVTILGLRYTLLMAEQIISLQAVASTEFQPLTSTQNASYGISRSGTPLGQPPLPAWLRTKSGKARQTVETGEQLRELSIVTVCEEARCPNVGECWSHKTATFMICGDKCTRACAFCNVATARPGALDPTEPERVAEAAKRLGLKYVVITSVDRDDLPMAAADIG
jgi:hypothetical protein